MTVGDRLACARRRQNLTQQQLANLVKTDQGTIARIESGRQSGAKHLPAMADKLDVPLSWLTVGDDPPAWYHGSGRVRDVSAEYQAAPPALIERIVASLERVADTLVAIDGHLARQAERDGLMERERADLRAQIDRLQQDVRQNLRAPAKPKGG
jgi:transcriptional regulator with XRE-family HTH domain